MEPQHTNTLGTNTRQAVALCGPLRDGYNIVPIELVQIRVTVVPTPIGCYT
jgi:hypothetical protein